MKTFTINGKNFKSVPFDFNLICDLEDNGLSLNAVKEKPMSMVRIYLAKCMGISVKDAGEEIQAHVVNGGNLSDVMDALSEEMANSDFFRALDKATEKKVTKSTKAKTE